MASFQEQMSISEGLSGGKSERIAYITMITSDSYLPGVQALVKVSMLSLI